MSASLVGSEMCIRDSFPTAPSSALHCLLASGLAVGSPLLVSARRLLGWTRRHGWLGRMSCALLQ
eukprot:1844815-Alexandrium_andersonii.AAC.1